MSVTTLLDFIKQDYELKCRLALAQFLEISPGKVINLYRLIDEVDEPLIDKILVKTDLTRVEIDEFLRE